MDVHRPTEERCARIAGTIGDPARSRMLYALMDGRAHTSTELALVAGVGPSTTSTHLNRLKRERLVRVLVQGRHRYYSLGGTPVARVLESLLALSGPAERGVPVRTPHHLRLARTCYDHIAGTAGVLLHDRLVATGWIETDDAAYTVTPKGVRGFGEMGIDVLEVQGARRQFALPCLDWSERRFHLGGALGAALLDRALARKWVRRVRDERALVITALGARELRARLGLKVEPTGTTP